ncbi:MAG TPA: glycosyltransferase [Frankiaceae bacterium]|nr:glycosyltransferase [Frankiaceae bacterium]
MTTSPQRAMPVVVQQFSGNQAEAAHEPITRPLVFVSVGTDHHPFNRLVQWVDGWAATHPDVEVVIQHGEATGPVHAVAMPYLSHSELFGLIGRSDVIVSHGGPATIAEAWNVGLIPVVAPRGHRLGEHVDDHQQAFAAVLAEREQVIRVTTESELVEALDHALADPQWLRRTSGLGVDVDTSIRNFAAVVTAVTGKGGRRARAERRKAFRRIAK